MQKSGIFAIVNYLVVCYLGRMKHIVIGTKKDALILIRNRKRSRRTGRSSRMDCQRGLKITVMRVSEKKR